ncbi:MAG: LTA synthase family protein, partial [Muribaculaceae bacterium]|nr:LTA synthase family protein [Muribaculaceae bacterium]
STYYYGGDANFTNMKAYLLSSGFDKVVSDVDFPVSDRMSKWGVLDHRLLERAIADVRDGSSPSFTVIQTSSSHEPFDVPYSNEKLDFDKAANAFGYTDEVVAQFVDNLRRSPRWDNALVILVPDHYAAYPRNEEDFLKRHHVPLVMTGGALAKNHRRIEVPMSQSDIAATLLGAMGLDHSAFRFSRDVMYPGAKGAAFFSSIGNAGWVTPRDPLVYEYTGGKVINGDTDHDVALTQLKAFLQILYTDFEQPQLLAD